MEKALCLQWPCVGLESVIGGVVWVFRINISLGRGSWFLQGEMMCGCQTQQLLQSQSGAQESYTISAIKLAFILTFISSFIFHTGGNKTLRDLLRLLSEMHVNIFTRGLQGINLCSRASAL